jgi:SAM-dependent methyltransferase
MTCRRTTGRAKSRAFSSADGETVSSGVHRTSPVDPGAWDRAGREADALPTGWRRHGRDVHQRLVHDWVGPPTGRWLKTDLFEERSDDRALVPLGRADWVGIDLSSVVASESRARARAVCVADVRRLPFAADSFDGVLSTSTLDHFERRSEIGRALRELHRVLAPSAPLVLTLDNPRNPLIRLRNALPYSVSRRTGLVPFFVGKTLDEIEGRRALEGAGFNVKDVAYVLHAPHLVGTRPARWGWYARRVLPAFDRLATTRFGRRTGHYVAFFATA